MKLSDLLQEKVSETAEQASARYEKFKKMLASGAAGVTQQQVDGIKKIAASLWDTKMKAREKHLIDTHGAEWWELVKKQYPITQVDGKYHVNSEIRNFKDKDRGDFDYKGEAVAKVEKLVNWVHDNRKRNMGDVDGDIAKWVAKLDAVDKAKSVTEGKSTAEAWAVQMLKDAGLKMKPGLDMADTGDGEWISDGKAGDALKALKSAGYKINQDDIVTVVTMKGFKKGLTFDFEEPGMAAVRFFDESK